jgi:hypothetical protein
MNNWANVNLRRETKGLVFDWKAVLQLGRDQNVSCDTAIRYAVDHCMREYAAMAIEKATVEMEMEKQEAEAI